MEGFVNGHEQVAVGSVGARVTSAAQKTGGKPLPEDFERIFNENHALVYRVAYRVTGSNEDAEDVLQTLFLRLLRREILPDIERNPKAYMHRAAINIALDIVKQRSRNVTTGNVEDELVGSVPQQRMPAFRIQDWLRDALAELSLLEPVVKRLGSRATLHLLVGADHSFHVLKSSGRNDREVLGEALDAFAAWVDGVIG